jgi:hypothetical protein
MADKTTRRPPIQPVSRERKKAAALKDCRCFEEAERRLRMGHSSAKLVKFIQEDSGELTHLSPGYIRKMLDEHRKTIPPADLALTSKNTTVSMQANRKLANGLNELEELESLYTKQKERIEIEMGNERKINKLLPQTGREIFYAMKILKQSADLKMDLGIAKRQLGEVSVTGHASVQIGERYNDGVGGVMANADSRRKVLGMVQTLAALSEKADMDVVDVIKSAANAVGSEIIDIPTGDEAASTETEQ